MDIKLLRTEAFWISIRTGIIMNHSYARFRVKLWIWNQGREFQIANLPLSPSNCRAPLVLKDHASPSCSLQRCSSSKWDEFSVGRICWTMELQLELGELAPDTRNSGRLRKQHQCEWESPPRGTFLHGMWAPSRLKISSLAWISHKLGAYRWF